MKDLNFLTKIPEQRIVKANPPSARSMVAVFFSSFILIIAALNGPLVIAAIKYPFQHSTESDNERLTAQYRAIYGYNRQQNLTQDVSVDPVINTYQLPSDSSVAKAAEPTELNIDKLGISAPIILVNSVADSVILNALKNGVVLYPGSALPGQPGTTVIVGHSSSNPPWTKYSAIFSQLNKLAPFDIISISYQGQTYYYRVKAIEHGSVQQLLDKGLAGDLVLSSCWPVGTDRGRIVVVANLIK